MRYQLKPLAWFIETYKTIKVICITLKYMMQLGSQTTQIDSFLYNTGANMQMIISHILMLHACSSCKANANFFGSSAIVKQFLWIPRTIPLVFIHHQAWQIFGSLTKFSKPIKYQSIIEHFTCVLFTISMHRK